MRVIIPLVSQAILPGLVVKWRWRGNSAYLNRPGRFDWVRVVLCLANNDLICVILAGTLTISPDACKRHILLFS